jgi:hypothetical protein
LLLAEVTAVAATSSNGRTRPSLLLPLLLFMALTPVPSEGLACSLHASEAGDSSCPGMLYGRATVPQPAGCGSLWVAGTCLYL